MAIGPFIAVPLTRAMDPWMDRVHWGGFTINAITVGGWLMVVGCVHILTTAAFHCLVPSVETTSLS